MHSSDLFIVLLVLLLIFLIARELICWYWKLNKIVSLLESIDGKLNLDDKIEQIQIALDKIEGNSIGKSSASNINDAAQGESPNGKNGVRP